MIVKNYYLAKFQDGSACYAIVATDDAELSPGSDILGIPLERMDSGSDGAIKQTRDLIAQDVYN